MKRTVFFTGIAILLIFVPTAVTPAYASVFGKKKEQQREENVTFQLVRLAENVGRLGDASKGSLTAEQAKKIYDIIQPLRKQDKLTQEQAKEAYDGINGILTDEQKETIGEMKPEKKGWKGGPGAGGPPSDGNMPPPPMEHQGRFSPEDMKDFNPFNPSKNVPMASDLNKKWDVLLGKLEDIAGISKKNKKDKK